jgi:hypothetical protein
MRNLNIKGQFPVFISSKIRVVLWCSSCGAPWLTRGRVCNLFIQVVMGLASADTLRSKNRKALDHISLFHIVASYNSQGYCAVILFRLQTGLYPYRFNFKLSYDRRSGGQSIPVSGYLLAPATNFYLRGSYLQSFAVFSTEPLSVERTGL